MPSTYTVNLGIEKPATGEQSGTWGDTTNVNFDILDQAVNGAARVTLTSAGSSGSPNTLAITNGATSDGRNKWVEFYSSSDLGGNVFVQLDPNDAEKIVFVRNSLGGSQSVILFQGTYDAGRDLEVPAGMDMVVKFDGGGATATTTNVFQQLRTEALNIAGDGATVTGIKDEDDMASNSATKLATQQSIKAYVDSQVGTVDTLAEILANGNTTGGTDIAVSANDDITFTDSSKAIFGAGSDLQIYHDGSHSIIEDAGTGAIKVKVGDFRVENASGNNLIKGVGDVATLHNAGNEKLATTSTGIDITGTLTSDGLTVDGAVLLNGANALTLRNDTSTDADEPKITFDNDTFAGANYANIRTGNGGLLLKIESPSTSTFQNRHQLVFNGGAGDDFSYNLSTDNGSTYVNYFKIDGGNVVFNETGADKDFRVESNNNANMLFVDGGTDRIGIGTSSPSTFMHAQSSGDIQFRFETTSDSTAQIQYKNGNNQWSAGIDNLEQFFIYDSTNAHSALTFIPLDEVVFNQNSKDVDFRIESDSNANMLFVDASTNRVAMGTSVPSSILHARETSDIASTLTLDHLSGGNSYGGFLQSLSGTNQGFNMGGKFNGSYTRQLTVSSTEIALNEDSRDQNFRVESNNSTHMIFVDSDQNEVGINTSSPGSTLEVNGNFRPTYYYPHSPTSQTSSNNNNYWKLGNMYLPGPYGAEIVMHGAKPGYSSGGTNVGKLTILLRGGTNASLLDAVFYAEGDNSSVPCQSVRYVPNGNYEFEIYVQLGNYTSTSHTVVTGGSWTEDVVNTGSTSAPNNSVGIPAQRATWLGPNEVMSQYTYGTTINETGNDHDFRVESNGNANMLFVDGGSNKIGIGSSSFNYGSALTVHANDDGGTPSSVFLRNSGTSGGSGARLECGYVTGYGAAIRFSGNPSSYRMYGTYFERITGDGPTYATSGEFGTTGIFKAYEGAVFNENGGDKDFRVESDTSSYGLFLDAGHGGVGINDAGSASYQLSVLTGAMKSQMLLGRNTDGSARSAVVFYSQTQAAIVGRITMNNSATAYLTSSDYRLKENVVDLTDATTRLKQLQPKRFSWICEDEDSANVDGFLAHEVSSIVPEAVSGEKDALDESGNPEYQGIDQAKLVPLLVATIKELEARITALENA